MEHIEPDELAALAIDGDQPDASVRAHLDECVVCRAEYESLARTASLGRGGPPPLAGELPSSSVWASIHAELGLAPTLAADPLVAHGEPTAPTGPTAPLGRAPRVADSARAPETEAAAGPPPTGRAGRSAAARWWPLAAAAAVVGVVAGTAIGIGIAQNAATPQTVVARAALEPFPGWEASGEALVEEDADGARSVVVDLDAAVPTGSVREVWLIRSDASGLVSLGLLDGASGRFTVPSGIDLGEYPIVDVSAEPVDGDPAHSGDSIVRGELR